MSPTDQTLPAGKWAFDSEVAACFDDMLRRSIPQHDVMRRSVFDIGARFVKPGTDIVDLGCSRGDALAPFVERFSAGGIVSWGVEISEPMLAVARQRFARDISDGRVKIEALDLRREFPRVRASVILAVLTVQFTPIEYRQAILQRVHDHLVPGGAFILVEKVLGATAALDEMMVGIYLGMKAGNGYTSEQIARKRASLEGVLVPVRADWNIQALHDAGFRAVDCFWRWMNFAGWVAIK